jgi:hypothetical protein
METMDRQKFLNLCHYALSMGRVDRPIGRSAGIDRLNHRYRL